MKKIIQNSIFILFSTFILFSCSGDDLELTSANYNAKLLKTFIYDSDLVGEWKIKSMLVNKKIDLNADGESNEDLLRETSCFEEMIYTFKGDKTFTIINPTLELTMLDDEDSFNCQPPATISGKWSIKDDTLILFIRTNGADLVERKHLVLTDDLFYLEINEKESMQFINDKGNSSVSGLSVVVLEFKRTPKKF